MLTRFTEQELLDAMRTQASNPATSRAALASGYRWRIKQSDGQWHLTLNRDPDPEQMATCEIERVEVVAVEPKE